MQTSPPDELQTEDEINLRAYWCALAQRRWLIVGVVCLVVGLTTLYTLSQPDIYEGKVTLLPLGQSRSNLPAGLSDLSGFLPVGAMLGRESPSERLLVVLQSRTLAVDVIRQLGLLPLLFARQWDAERQRWRTALPPTEQDAVKQLGTRVSITASKQGLISIVAKSADPVLAAAIANRYVDGLQWALNDKAFSLAKKNRVFIEAQLEHTRSDLTVAEENLQRFEQEHKIIALDAQTTAAVEAVAAVEGQIRAKEVQLAVQQRLTTGASREVSLMQEELRGLRSQLTRLQHGAVALRPAVDTRGQDGRVWPSLDEAPEIKLRYARIQREALIQNKLFTLLAQQLEQAKIEEARDETAFQVLDRAIPADRKSGPKRASNILLAVFGGLMGGVGLAFWRAYTDSTIRTREQVERQVGLEVLATLPLGVPRTRRHARQGLTPLLDTDLVVHQPPGTPALEALRYLYVRLRHSSSVPNLRTVLLTSPAPPEDTTTVLVNLASMAASMGDKTLLVDSNLHQPTLHSVLRCAGAPGLADLLVHPQEWQQAVQTTLVPNLALLPAGTVTQMTHAAFGVAAFEALLAQMKAHYDVILCAAPPMLGHTDAALLGGRVDATCVVLTCGASHVDTAVEARRALEAVQARVIGAILIDSI